MVKDITGQLADLSLTPQNNKTRDLNNSLEGSLHVFEIYREVKLSNATKLKTI